MIGGADTQGIIQGNEIGGRGEHTAAPDGCAIDFEGGSDGVQVLDNFIHDSYGAGIMVFGLSDPSRNISNARIIGNVMLRNGAVQTSDDHGAVVFMEIGSSGTVANNLFYSDNPDPAFVLRERVPGTTAQWQLQNNTIRSIDHLEQAFSPTPAINAVQYADDGSLTISFTNRVANVPAPELHVTTDGSLPTLASPIWELDHSYMVNRTTAINARFFCQGLLPSVTMTYIATVPLDNLLI